MSNGIDTRQRLLVSAWELIYARSFGDVGVQAICHHAGVNKGSFYHFFRSKQELILAVLDEFALDFEQDLLGKALRPGLSPLARLERLLELVYRFQRAVAEVHGQVLGCLFGNLSSELSSLDPEVRRRIEGIFDRLSERLAETLDQAQADAILPPLDSRASADAMLAYLQGLQLLARTRNDPELIRRLGPAMLQLRIAPRHD
jgi:TetR/AcrR family transcriptional repressor of nem operon